MSPPQRPGALRHALRAYPTLVHVCFINALAYRAEIFVWMLMMTMPLIMLALWSAVAREGQVGRFDGPAFTSYFLATLIVRQLASSWIVWELIREVRDGTLATRLLRPLHPLIAFSAVSLGNLPFRAVICVPVAFLAWAAVGPRAMTHDPVQLLAFALSLVGAYLLNFCVSAIIGSLSLYVESSAAIWDLWLGLFMALSGYTIPLELFPRSVERIARVLPFQYLQAVPVEIVTGLRDRHQAFIGLAGQAGWTVGAMILMVLVWRHGLRRYAAYGG